MTTTTAQKTKLLKTVIWGTGQAAQNDFLIVNLLSRGHDIIGYIDNNADTWGKMYKGRPVFSPQKIRDGKLDYIIVASSYYKEIAQQLRAMGVTRERIIHYPNNTKHGVLHTLGNIQYLVGVSYACENEELVTKTRLFKINGPVVRESEPPIPIDQQIPLICRLRDAYKAARRDMHDVPSAYETGTNWQLVFDLTRNQFYEVINKNDDHALAALYARFFRSTLTSSMGGGSERTAHALATNERFVNGVIQTIVRNFIIWNHCITIDEVAGMDELGLPLVGSPTGIDVDGAILIPGCFRHHYKAWYFSKLLKDVSRPVIAEIGAGWGHCAYYWLRRPGRRAYINFDLPENLMTSSYFLSMAFPDKRICVYADKTMSIDENLIREYDIILMPHFMLPQLAHLSVDLFFNTVSLSEMERSTIREYIHQIARTTRYYFYHKNLSHAPNQYKGYPASVFPAPEPFDCLYRKPSLWPGWGVDAPGHTYVEYLYKRRK